jgi:hypothetical protein
MTPNIAGSAFNVLVAAFFLVVLLGVALTAYAAAVLRRQEDLIAASGAYAPTPEPAKDEDTEDIATTSEAADSMVSASAAPVAAEAAVPVVEEAAVPVAVAEAAPVAAAETAAAPVAEAAPVPLAEEAVVPVVEQPMPADAPTAQATEDGTTEPA